MLARSLRVSSDTDRQTTCNALRDSTPAWRRTFGLTRPTLSDARTCRAAAHAVW
jgi:hypothetical protein